MYTYRSARIQAWLETGPSLRSNCPWYRSTGNYISCDGCMWIESRGRVQQPSSDRVFDTTIHHNAYTHKSHHDVQTDLVRVKDGRNLRRVAHHQVVLQRVARGRRVL